MYGHGVGTQRAATPERLVTGGTGALSRKIPSAPEEFRSDRVLPPSEERKGLRQVCVRYFSLCTGCGEFVASEGTRVKNDVKECCKGCSLLLGFQL